MILTISTLVGGLGVFLLAMMLITDGLKLAAGNRLKVILQDWTTTRLRGLASGILVTALVQSSSAVTVATIGFVNAGLLTLGQSLGVIYGTNIGTTMTGWIVAALGFDFRIEAVALPMVGIGMLARLLRPESRGGELGLAVAGFGLFFMGVDLMKEAFESIAGNVDVSAMEVSGIPGTLTYVLVGIVLTVLTQSSSAAIAITLTAATGGLLALDAAAAIVIGTNVGTTSTAALAVLGATANARRVAAAHVIFNLATGAVALMLLPAMLAIVRTTGALLGLEAIPAVTLALFHTLFNILGVALMWPFTTRLSRFLNARFTTQAELLSKPQFLDSNVLATPSLALEALNLELGRAESETRKLVLTTLGSRFEGGRSWSDSRSGLETLCEAIAGAIANLEMSKLPEHLRGRMPQALRVLAYLEEVLKQLDTYREQRMNIDAISHSSVSDELAAFENQVIEHISGCDHRASGFSPEGSMQGYSELHDSWRQLKSRLLEAASVRSIAIGHLNLALEGIRATVRIAEQLGKASQWLYGFSQPDGKVENVNPAPTESGAAS